MVRRRWQRRESLEVGAGFKNEGGNNLMVKKRMWLVLTLASY